METNSFAIKARCLVAEAMRLINYGENLSFGWPKRSGKEAVDGWYCEINIYDFDNPVVTGGVIFVVTNNPYKVTGHFAQVVWRKSTKLGRARNTCGLGGNSGTLGACEYDPPGNFNASKPGVLDPNVPRPAQGFAGRHAASARHDITAQKITAIISNLDLYEVRGGNRRIIGMLRQGQTFSLIECRKDNWCKLSHG
jgi:hypothetical protein